LRSVLTDSREQRLFADHKLMNGFEWPIIELRPGLHPSWQVSRRIAVARVSHIDPQFDKGIETEMRTKMHRNPGFSYERRFCSQNHIDMVNRFNGFLTLQADIRPDFRRPAGIRPPEHVSFDFHHIPVLYRSFNMQHMPQ
jgi:hypothetical protein